MAHLTVCICYGSKKHMLLAKDDTTVEELATMVCIEVLEEYPPEDGQPTCSVIRLIFRGRQLTMPSLTLGALKVKNGERIMVLPKKNLITTAAPVNSSSTYTSQQNNGAASASTQGQQNGEEKIDDAPDPARDLKKHGNNIKGLEAAVLELAQSVRVGLGKPAAATSSDMEDALHRHLKTVAGLNEEHMKILLKLDAIETGGDISIRSLRKSLVVRVQHGTKTLDTISGAVKSALKGELSASSTLINSL